MSIIDYQLLEKNIRAQMKQKEITQSKLAEEIGMTQSNISKALNPMDSRQFTVEQLVKMSQFFGVSIDELLGNKPTGVSSFDKAAAFSFIANLLSTRKLHATTIEVKEEAYEEYQVNQYGMREYVGEEKMVQYPAFYFPNYVDPDDYPQDEFTMGDLQTDAYTGGNATGMYDLNDTLSSLTKLVKMYLTGELSEEQYRFLVKGYKEKLGQ